MRAASSTVRVIGPISSCVELKGMMPSRLISPRVGRSPTMPVAEAGERIDCPVSLPVPSTAKFAAMAAPVPPLDPPAVRVRSYGFLVCPPSELTVVPVSASSVRLAFAMMIAPASLNRFTTNASSGGTDLASVTEPPVVGMSAVSKLSFRMIGMQWSGGRVAPGLNARSIASAISMARGFTLMIARSAGPLSSYASMRSRYMRTSCAQVMARDASAA